MLVSCDNPTAKIPASDPTQPSKLGGKSPVLVRSSDPAESVPESLRSLLAQGAEIVPGSDSPALRRFRSTTGKAFRTFRPALPEEKDLLLDLTQQMSLGLVEEDARDRLAQAQGVFAEELLPLFDTAMRHPSARVREDALGLLEGGVGELAKSRFQVALDDPNEDVRLAALRASWGLDIVDLRSFLLTALENSSDKVRVAAFSTSVDLDPGTAALAKRRAFGGGDEQLTLSAIRSLHVHMERAETPVIMALLNSTHVQVQEEARDLLLNWTRQEFPDRQTAVTWWGKNETRFGEDMSELSAE